jgi:hypothetical protein
VISRWFLEAIRPTGGVTSRSDKIGLLKTSIISSILSGNLQLDDKIYGPAACKAWLGLVGLLDDGANLREICIGTNKGFDEEFYMSRPGTDAMDGQRADLLARAAPSGRGHCDHRFSVDRIPRTVQDLTRIPLSGMGRLRNGDFTLLERVA